jgi:hypothetical protein
MTTQIGCAANIGYGYARRKIIKTHRRQCKMSTSKKRPVKGLCGRCLTEFIGWRLGCSDFDFFSHFEA